VSSGVDSGLSKVVDVVEPVCSGHHCSVSVMVKLLSGRHNTNLSFVTLESATVGRFSLWTSGFHCM